MRFLLRIRLRAPAAALTPRPHRCQRCAHENAPAPARVVKAGILQLVGFMGGALFLIGSLLIVNAMLATPVLLLEALAQWVFPTYHSGDYAIFVIVGSCFLIGVPCYWIGKSLARFAGWEIGQ